MLTAIILDIPLILKGGLKNIMIHLFLLIKVNSVLKTAPGALFTSKKTLTPAVMLLKGKGKLKVGNQGK